MNIACSSLFKFFLKIYSEESTYNMFKDKLKIVPLNNLNKYLYNGKSKRVNANNSSKELKKKKHFD